MAIVHIRINGREYDIACDDGQEDQLRFLADEVDERVRALAFGMGDNPGEVMPLLITALTMADELAENKKEIKNLASLVDEDKKVMQETRMVEIEAAMAVTLEEIAVRIEKIAQQVELR